MIKLKRGIFESVASGFAGVVNFLISYTSGKFHAATSDGASYSEIDPLVFGTSNINDIEYAPDLTTPSSSQSLGSWTTVTISAVPKDFSGNITTIAYGNGAWIVGGSFTSKVQRSTNLVTWTTLNVGSGNFTKVSYGNQWIAGGGYQIYRSTDSLTWVSVYGLSGGTRGYFEEVSYGNGVWAAGVQGNPLYMNSSIAMHTSTNGISWSAISQSSFSSTWEIAYGNGIWAACGSIYASSRGGLIMTSTDLITWTSRQSNLSSGVIYDIAYGGGLWIIGGGIASTTGTICTSTDAITWTTQNAFFGTTMVTSLEYNNGLWLAGGYDGQLRNSTDGITWSTVNSTFATTRITAIAYGNNIWMNGGYTGQFRTAPNITTTTYPNNTILAAGNDGKAARSTNGISWATINTGATSNLTAISFVTTSATTQAYFVGGI